MHPQVATNSYNVAQSADPRVTKAPDINTIPRELNELAGATADLHSVIDALGARLDPICTPTPVGPDGVGMPPQQTASGLALSIREQRERVAYAANRLRKFMDAIEL